MPTEIISFVSVREEKGAYVATLIIGVDRTAGSEPAGSAALLVRRPAQEDPPGAPPPGLEGGPQVHAATGSIVPGAKS